MMQMGEGMPSMVTCERAARALYDYLDGQLPDAEMDVIREHATTCKECAPHFEFARRLLDMLPAAMPMVDVPRALRTRIVQSLIAEGYTGTVLDA
jgi:anti-sigma factor (TIGR02949 family)